MFEISNNYIFQYVFTGILGACCLLLSGYSGVYFILKYLTKSDPFKQNIVSKIFLMFSVALTTLIPLLLPIDTTLSVITDGTKQLAIMWQVLFYTVLVLTVIILPIMLFYIEELINEKGKCKTIMCVSIEEVICIVVIIVLNCIFYFTMGDIQLSIPTYTEPVFTPVQYQSIDLLLNDQITYVQPQYQGRMKLDLPIGFFNYMLSLFIFFTSIFFTVFFAIGLVSFPLGKILSFIRKPKIMSKTGLIEYKIKTSREAAKIVQRIDNIYSILLANNFMNDKNAMRQAIQSNDYKKLFGKEKKLKNEFIKLQGQAVQLRKQFDEVMSYNQKETSNPLKYIFDLILGIVCALLSLLLIVQILMVQIDQFFEESNSSFYFLSTMLNEVEKALRLPLFSSILFAIIAFYVTICYISGITKFGFRFVFFISIHEMDVGNTELNSLIFNIILVVGCSLACIKQLGQICSEFVRGSGIDIILSNITGSIKYLSYWFQYSGFALIVISIITLLYMLIKKPKKDKNNKKQKSNKQNSKQIEMKSTIQSV